MIIRYSPSLLGVLIYALSIVPPSRAIWPFPDRSAASTVEAFIDAGSLGLGDEQGRVVAVGDWNGDQQSDLFVLSKSRRVLQVYLWDKAGQRYIPGTQHTAQRNIQNVVPADWKYDGRLDLLVVTEGQKHGWWGGGSDVLEMQVVLQESDGAFGESWDVPSSTASQPVIFDVDGSLRPSMLGYPHTDGEDATDIQVWANQGDGLVLESTRLMNSQQACKLANPHSSAFVDIDGDCVPDLVLHCEGDSASMSRIQIWLNRGSEGYELSRTYELPRGSGPLTFADMNRDGGIDLVFPVCSHHSTSSGIGSDCSINIAYNKQAPLCSGETTTMNSDGSIKCRGWGELCVADGGYEFSFSSDDPYYYSTPLSSFFPSPNSASSILLSAPDAEHIPLPLRAGDYNQDGFPDLLLTIVNSTAQPGIGFGSRQGTQVKVLENVRCAKGLPGCRDGQGQGPDRTFKVGHGKGWEAIEGMWDVQGASWLDVDDDGSLDVMVQRSGDQDQGRVTFVRNGFYHDAFFLRAQVLNGACDGLCRDKDGGKAYSGAGASAIGASYKFTVLDTLGRRGAQQIPQIPQSGYHALGLPYSFIGLGRTNNYIERLTVGVSLHTSNTTSLDSIIPNSQLLITPPSAPSSDRAGDSQESINDGAMRDWHTELFLQPGQWVPWVGLSVIGTVFALGGVVWFLHEREKSEDELERRRALHAINFQAL